MNQAWQNFLEGRGALIENGDLAHFGDRQAELAASREGTILAPLPHFSLIRCNGEDAAGFLHNLLTNDVSHLSDCRAELNGFCNAKGRMLADFLLWRDGHDYFLQLSADIQPAILKKLGMYVLRSKVKLADAAGEYTLIGVAGRDAAAAVQAVTEDVPAEPYRLARFGEGCVIRLDAQRFEIVARSAAAAEIWEKLSAKSKPVGTDVWRLLDIAAGIPHITAPTQEEFVPQMVNFELIGGVSFTKGCYPGQEVVARTKYLGKVKRRTYRIHVSGATCPQAGTDLYSVGMPGQSCGKIVNAAAAQGGGCDALASLIMASAESGDVRLGAENGEKIEFRALPYPTE